MATYVNDLRLKEIATGDEAGTWGTSTNTNLELIGEALGYGTQDCFASDADATTTVADGATDPARAMYFKVTSSATLTATRTLTIAPNTISRVMLIENATTGSQSITISQGSGSTVTIASGAVKMVYLDGAGAGGAVVEALADLELPTVTVADLTATTADINGGTIDGTVIGGSTAAAITGTTITGTSFVSSGDMTFGDSDKAIFGAGSDLQIYHDGSDSYITHTTGGNFFINDDGAGYLMMKGSDLYFRNPSNVDMIHAQSGGFVKLYYNGVAKLATTSTGIDVTGTVTADGLTMASGSQGVIGVFGTSGLQLIGQTGSDNIIGTMGVNEPLVFRTVSTEKMRIASNGDISFYEDTGTTPKLTWSASAQRLDVQAVGADAADSTVLRLSQNNFSTGGTTLVKIGTEGTTWSKGAIGFERTGDFDKGALIFCTNNTTSSADVTSADERMRITSSGALELTGDSGAGATFLNFTADSNATKAQISGFKSGASGGELTFSTNNSSAALTERMRIDSSGNLGLGVTPSAWGSSYKAIQNGQSAFMSRSGGADSYLLTNNYYDGTNFRYINTAPASRYQQDVGVHSWFTAPSGTAGNAITFTQAMTLDASGNLLSGTTTSKGSRVQAAGAAASVSPTLGSATDTSLLLSNSDVTYGMNFGVINNGNGWIQQHSNTGTAAAYNLLLQPVGGNVGIGTSSPVTLKSATTLQVSGNAKLGDDNGRGLLSLGDIISTGANVGIWRGAAGAYAGIGNYLNLGGYDGITFTTGAADISAQTERMRIDSSGNVAIGHTSANSSRLHLRGVGSAGTPQLMITDNSSGKQSEIRQDTSGNLVFDHWTGASRSERMRIDSSGNLLVGTTSTIPFTFSSGTGAGITSTGTVMAGATAEAGLFNRIGSDGSIVNFYKAGAIVGSIGISQSGSVPYIGGTDTGICFNSATNGVLPADTSTPTAVQSDATKDLGFSSVRWRNLYLSGGVYLGGTGAANLLDDYEEGTWTPAYQTSNNDITYTAGTNVNGKYTKVGNTVFFSLMIRGNITGGTGDLRITGLPFAAVTVNSAGCPCYISANYEWTSSPGTNPLVAVSLIALGSIGATNFSATAIGASKSGSNSFNEVTLAGSYQVS
jgi:hypothetical protein